MTPPPNSSSAQNEEYVTKSIAFNLYNDLFEQATAASIPVLNTNRFFLLIGQTDR